MVWEVIDPEDCRFLCTALEPFRFPIFFRPQRLTRSGKPCVDELLLPAIETSLHPEHPHIVLYFLLLISLPWAARAFYPYPFISMRALPIAQFSCLSAPVAHCVSRSVAGIKRRVQRCIDLVAILSYPERSSIDFGHVRSPRHLSLACNSVRACLCSHLRRLSCPIQPPRPALARPFFLFPPVPPEASHFFRICPHPSFFPSPWLTLPFALLFAQLASQRFQPRSSPLLRVTLPEPLFIAASHHPPFPRALLWRSSAFEIVCSLPLC